MMRKFSFKNLTPDVKARMNQRIFQALTARALVASFIYVTLYLAIGLFTPLFYNFPHQAVGFGLGIAIFSVARCYMSYFFQSENDNPGPLCRACFYVSILGTSLSWGLFCAYTLAEYRIGINSMIVLFPTAGIAGGSVLSLSPFFRLIVVHLCLLLAPSIGVLLAQKEIYQAQGYAALTVIFLIYLCIQARGICNAILLSGYNMILLEDAHKSQGLLAESDLQPGQRSEKPSQQPINGLSQTMGMGSKSYRKAS